MQLARRAITLSGLGVMIAIPSLEVFFRFSDVRLLKAIATTGILLSMAVLAVACFRPNGIPFVLASCATIAVFIVLRSSTYGGLAKDEDTRVPAIAFAVGARWFCTYLLSVMVLAFLARVAAFFRNRSSRQR
ncbi:MAG TPA: hypothetical protein VGR02_14870 [Thermoanaerobaculia bacterium]|nr:hypothetical protein [Thermoanaerobaculia bacterium]